jgi:hypothetical protein
MALHEYDRVAYDEANSAAVNGSLGSQIINSESATAAGSSDPANSPTTPAVTHPMFTFSGDSLITSNGTLNLAPLRAAGVKAKAEANKTFQSCYEEFFQNDLYFVAFLLDPREVSVYFNLATS